jgi:FkbM family methyltransferase
MLSKKLITSRGNTHHLTSNDPVVIDWFNRPSETHTDIIIDQINAKMYDRFLNGRQDLVIIDVGANIGLWSIYAQDSCKKLVSVEPAPHNVYIFEQIAQGMDNISIDMSALSNADGSIKMNIHTSPTCNSIIYQTDTDLAIDVETKTIATLLNSNGLEYVDFIKCDIEGAESLAFSEETLDPVKNQIGSWLIETHQTDTHTGMPWPGNLEINRQSIMSVLRNAGYNTEAVIHDQIYAWKN